MDNKKVLIPSDVHNAAKVAAAKLGITLSIFVATAIRKDIKARKGR